jgi:prepilin-type N-terminal cleavage/methylation domain-containing protein
LPYKRREAGFTLVELIITVVLIGIIASVAAMLILQGVRGYSDEEIRSDLTNQARLGIERMAREIREARDCPDISTMSATEVAFCDVSGKAVGFRITGTELQRRDSTTCSPPVWGPWVALASSVDSGISSFSYYRRDDTVAGSAALVWTIQVSLTVARSGESHTHRIRVHPRGFQSASCG